MKYDVIHSMQIKVIGGYMNAREMLPKQDADLIHCTKLDEAIFTSTIHKAIVRAINKIKDTGAEVCELNVSYFLERHGIPRTINEADEISRIQSEIAITPKSFSDYIAILKRERGKAVAL